MDSYFTYGAAFTALAVPVMSSLSVPETSGLSQPEMAPEHQFGVGPAYHFGDLPSVHSSKVEPIYHLKPSHPLPQTMHASSQAVRHTGSSVDVRS